MLALLLLTAALAQPVTRPADLFFAEPGDAAYRQLLDEAAPHVDPFGQPIHLDWPGKITAEGDLAAEDVLPEAVPADDDFGGFGQPVAKPGRTYRLVGGRLLTPTGRRVVYLGVDGATDAGLPATPIDGRRGLFAELPRPRTPLGPALAINPYADPADLGREYVSHRAMNLIRVFGDRWRDAADDRAGRRLRALAFTGAGRVADAPAGVSHLAEISLPPVTDARPTVVNNVAAMLRRQVAPRRNNPHLVGYTLAADPLPAPADTRALLTVSGTPAKRALLDAALADEWDGDGRSMLRALRVDAPEQAVRGKLEPDNATLERLHAAHRRAAARVVAAAFDQADPDRPTFGDPLWADVELVDVPDGEAAAALPLGEKPVLVTLAFPIDYGGTRGFGPTAATVATEAEAAARYAESLAALAGQERVVGVLLRHWVDEPVTGIGPGEAFELVVGPARAAGVVGVADRVKAEFAEGVREANLDARPR